MRELLSPAGTTEAFYAAISNGCNAIYLGIDKFNARAYANNFSLENLEDLVKFAHLRNVKIYVTMNTILYDEELDEAFKTIDELATIQVDAIIVQDLSLLYYITNHYGSIEAHVSTQMGIDDIYGSILVKNLGATRIVFARETPLDVMKDIKEKLNIEIEAFIHGALCVAYSGNCLMSSMIGDRSGNRGRCAGCCRQKYTLIDVNNNKIIKTGYLLSMKDLNTSQFIDEMDFVDSLKIEGRMKEPSYVGGVTNFYRRLIDKEIVNQDDIYKVFNRTYTKGFMNSESSEDITNIERPNNNGYLIGKIVKINKETIWIKLFKQLNKGDQIRIDSPDEFKEISVPVLRLFDANFKECESTNKVAIVSCHEKVNIGANVYKTKDNLFNKRIEETFRFSEYKKLGLEFKFFAKINDKLKLIVRFENFEIEETHDYIVQKAIKSSTTKENVENQLSKLNDTPYILDKLEIVMDDEVFIPLKFINELRRNAIDKLNKKRLETKVITKNPNQIVVNSFDIHEPEITVEVTNDEQFKVAKELGIKHIYYKNIVRRNNAKYIAGGQEVLVGGLGGIEKYKNSNSIIVTDYSLNVTNYISAAILNTLGVNRITLSQEINKEHINDLINNYYEEFGTYPNLELIVYGRSFLMHSKYCPLKRLGMCGECKKTKFVLKDRYEEFPLTFNDDCTTNVLNAKTLNIMDNIKDMKGINFYRLVFTTENSDETRKVINTFKSIMSGNFNGKTFNNHNQTRGHFIKNPL